MRMPVRSEWSFTSEISLSTFSLTRSAIFLITPESPPFFTPYGSSVTMIAFLPPRSSSTCARPRMMIRPRPVRYASRTPERPTMIAPVGKSGPLTCAIRSSAFAVGLSISWTTASTTSGRRCGGMFVAIPTAIPAEPFTRRFGKRDGSTDGSFRDSS